MAQLCGFVAAEAEGWMRAESSAMWDQVSIPGALGTIILPDMAELFCCSRDLNHSQPFLSCSDLTWRRILPERSPGGRSSESRQGAGSLFTLETPGTRIMGSQVLLSIFIACSTTR